MPSPTVNICVFSLVLLCFHQICHCRPNRNKRGLVKDYFVPDTLVFASDKFQKGDDGKYYLKQSAHRRDSEVDYIPADNTGKKNDVLSDVSEVETVRDDSKTVESANIKTGLIKKEQSEKEVEHASTSIVKQTKEVSEKMDNDDKKAPFIPANTKFTDPPKPDAKDEVSFKTDLTPTESEEKVDQKITIGQVPELYSRLVPAPENSRIPILIPIRHISYRTMKIIPIPPTGVSDRLPVPYDDDIVGEGAHESESEEVSRPLAEGENGYPFVNPLMSLLSFHNILKDLKEADKEDVGKESKVVDVLGKKFLMQSNVMKYPANDNSHTYIRFMSVKPLDDLKPEEPKAVEETLEKEIEVEERKAIDIAKEEFEAKEKVEVKEKKVMTESEAKKETGKRPMKETEVKLTKESEEKLTKETEEKLTKTDILKPEETELRLKIEKNIPKEVIIKNMDKEEIDDEMENNKEIKSIEEVLKKINIPLSEIEMAEKAESQLKVVNVKKNDEAEEKTKRQHDGSVVMEDENENKKIKAVEDIARKYEEKMNMGSKKDVFLLEKKKKERTLNEGEEANQKKKTPKKKKCKCEEKDSDSDDDLDE